MLHKFTSLFKKYALKVTIGIALGLIAGFFWYTSDYYKADQFALTILEKQNVIEYDGFVEIEADSDIGFIFYPGGKVEAYAYLVLLKSLSDEGISIFLVKMPFNLAVFNIDAADSIREDYPNIKHWYIGGHSLGGAMASQHLSANSDSFDGLIQLAAYPVNTSEKNVLILYGSQDEVLDLTKLEGFDALSIQGGNHAFFGNYGDQAGDGIANISRTDQQKITVETIIDFMR